VKILLLDPPHQIFAALRMWMPSPGLMALGSYLEREGFDVDVIDSTTLTQPWSDLEQKLKATNYDVVGVTCQAATFHKDAIHAVRQVRRCLPDTIIIGGGGHFTLNYEVMFSQAPEVDFIVLGEGELTFTELLNNIPEKNTDCNIKGIADKKNGEIKFTDARPQIADLDTLPMPGYHLMDIMNPTYYIHGMGTRMTGISTSRGCGDHCSYCSESQLWNAKWRGRSGGLVVKEMEMLNQNYGKSLFVFNEISFNQTRKRNEDFLEALGQSGLKCDFWFQSRIKDILRDKDLLPEFKKLGLYEVMLGVESISPAALKNYTKNQSAEQIREAAELLKSHGIMVMTNVMFGDVDDTEETLNAIFDFAAELGDFLVMTLTTPLPGTRYYTHCEDENRIEERDFSKYDFMNPVIKNNAYYGDEILALQKKYLRKYYTRPIIFWKMFFSTNEFIRMAYKLIMRYAYYEARNMVWVQDNFQEVPAEILLEKEYWNK
jgi:anaerobic magnesium-protoporphyrin IX monomethyl ester cyclase